MIGIDIGVGKMLIVVVFVIVICEGGFKVGVMKLIEMGVELSDYLCLMFDVVLLSYGVGDCYDLLVV